MSILHEVASHSYKRLGDKSQLDKLEVELIKVSYIALNTNGYINQNRPRVGR